VTPEQAADIAEIAQVLQRYGQALDEKRYELLDGVFLPDARLHYDMGGEGPTTYPEMAGLFRSFMVPFMYTQHIFSHPVVELDGDRARASARLIATHVQVRLAGGRNVWTVYGFYEDALIRTDAGWRIEQRVFKGMHTEGTLLPADQVEHFEKAPHGAGGLP
jgi:hypothetical protein